jgi:hypothetical protein
MIIMVYIICLYDIYILHIYYMLFFFKKTAIIYNQEILFSMLVCHQVMCLFAGPPQTSPTSNKHICASNRDARARSVRSLQPPGGAPSGG